MCVFFHLIWQMSVWLLCQALIPFGKLHGLMKMLWIFPRAQSSKHTHLTRTIEHNRITFIYEYEYVIRD